jgi:hypothetical protein
MPIRRMLCAVTVLFSLFLTFAPAAQAQDATLDAVLSFVGPGPGGYDVYRYDYTLTNNAVSPAVIELLVFFDSDPDSGVLFLGDVTDFDNSSGLGFNGATTSPAGWLTDVFEDPDPSPWVVDFFNFDGSNIVRPGESLAGFSVTFLWKGSGVPGEQFFEAINGFAHEGKTTVIVSFAPITGTVSSACTGAPLNGVPVDLFTSEGELLASTFTDASGNYVFNNLPPGNYTVSISTPIGYEEPGDVPVTPGSPANVALVCLEIENSPRTIGFWKHQANVHLTGRGKAQVPLSQFLGQLDLIYDRFAQSVVHPVAVYTVDPSATDSFKLETAKDILTVSGGKTMELRARQQLMALLLNVASLLISQAEIISGDGATVSQAITFAWDLIADGDPDNDETAKTICDVINNGGSVGIGIIPVATPNITYEQPRVDYRVATGFKLAQNAPNPVRAAGTEIRFALGQAGSARLMVFDAGGRLVRTLLDGVLSAGEATVRWDGRDEGGHQAAAGVYFYRLESDEHYAVRKLIKAN